jgi:hypothetical protein
MINRFWKGKAVIEAKLSLASRQASNHRRSSEWSFYIASVLTSSNSALEVRAHLRWRISGRGSVHNAGKWRAMAAGCGWKGMGSIAGRSVA